VRAAKKVPGLDYFVGKNLGGQLVFFDPLSLMSYAMARLKSDNIYGYRNADPRYWRRVTEADLRAALRDERHQKLLAKNGAWWQDVELAKAKACGDQKRVVQLQAMVDARMEAYAKAIRDLAS
jgi:hypothetical protein